MNCPLRAPGTLLPATAITRHAVLLTTAALVLVPFAWMVSLSLKPPGEIFRASFSFWPERFNGVENYTAALTKAPLLQYMLNGVLVCGISPAGPGLCPGGLRSREA